MRTINLLICLFQELSLNPLCKTLPSTCPGISTDLLLPEHHGSVTPHKAKDPFLNLGGEGQKQDLGDGVVLIPVEIPAEQCVDVESPLSPASQVEQPSLPAPRPLRGEAGSPWR
jgi:hypothetical protein